MSIPTAPSEPDRDLADAANAYVFTATPEAAYGTELEDLLRNAFMAGAVWGRLDAFVEAEIAEEAAPTPTPLGTEARDA